MSDQPATTKEFTLYWLGGKSEIVEGENVANAMTQAGYGNGAVRALDFYSHGDTRDAWKFVSGHWDRTENVSHE